MNIRQRIEKWWRGNVVGEGCPYCEAIGDCFPDCVTRKCPECGGLGVVIDLNNPYGIDEKDGVLYSGKPCPRGCEAP